MRDPDISTNDDVIPKYDKMVLVGAILCGTQISLPTTTLNPRCEKIVVGAILCGTQIYLTMTTLNPKWDKMVVAPSCAGPERGFLLARAGYNESEMQYYLVQYSECSCCRKFC